MYKLTSKLNYEGQEIFGLTRVSDNANIPFDPANTDFLAYQKWLAEGNEPLPPDEPALPETV